MSLWERLVRLLRRLFRKKKRWYEIDMRAVARTWAETHDKQREWREREEREEFHEYLQDYLKREVRA